MSAPTRRSRGEPRRRGGRGGRAAVAGVLGVALAFAAGLLAACIACVPAVAHRPAGARPCAGRAVIQSAADLARVARCQTWDGDVVIRGAAVVDLAPLASLRRVTGSLTVGPTTALTDIALPALDRVGALSIESNLSAGGAFMPALTDVQGALAVVGNPALATLSAPTLTSVHSVRIEGNAGLERVDLAALTTIADGVAAAVDIRRNPSLDAIVAPALDRQDRAIRSEDAATAPRGDPGEVPVPATEGGPDGDRAPAPK